MKLVRTEEAVGHVLCHDMTQIIPGVTKTPGSAKRHVVTEADIPVLLSMGKEHLYVWENNRGCCTRTRRRKFCFALCHGKIPAGRRRRKKGRLN